MEINIKILAPDLSSAIQSLADAIVAAGCRPETIGSTEIAATIEEMIEKIELPAEDKPEKAEKVADKPEKTKKAEAKPPAAEQPELTLEDVRAEFVSKNSQKNRDALKRLLSDFKVKKVSEVKEQDFAEVMKRLEAM